MAGHVVPVWVYVAVFLALMVLTGLTTGVAFINLGLLNTVVALAIAGVKMLLVVLFFMHVWHSSSLTKLVIVAGFFWLALLMGLTLADEYSRHWDQTPASWQAPAAAPSSR